MSGTHDTSKARSQRINLESPKRNAWATKIESDSRRETNESVFLGESVAVRRLRSQMQRIAPYFRTALIRGEIGSGKEIVARELHAKSPAVNGPFIVAHAGELAGALLESARGGTLYLGGVGELSFSLQDGLSRFLHALDEQRAGAVPSSPPHLNVRRQDREAQWRGPRILASSDRDLRTLSAVGQFRQDLYARLAAVEILVPPLRQRLEDIPSLAAWLLRRLAEESGQPPKVLATATVTQLQEQVWPGNLRELERVVTQAAALAEGGVIEPRHLLAPVEPGFANPLASQEFKMEPLHDVMMRHVLDVLTGCRGNKVRAAEVLGISRSTLYRMLGARPAEQPLA
jgi:DNA-binding NtrC family response regulator